VVRAGLQPAASFSHLAATGELAAYPTMYNILTIEREYGAGGSGSCEPMLQIPEGRIFDTDTLVSVAERLIEEAGRRGRCVIVGRGSPYVLRQRNDRFSVFLYAPRELKIRCAMAQNMSKKEAAQLVDTVDVERATFVKRYFGKDWPCRDLYDMMLNTECGYDTAVDLIRQVMEIKAQCRASIAS
jgi:hypothetical protein